MRYVDANVFVRYLTQDEPAMAATALRFFQRVRDNEEQVRVLDATVAEVVYVLASPKIYNRPRGDIRDRLTPILLLSSIQLQNRTRCLTALSLYASHAALSFGDSLLVAAAMEERPPELYSFDRGIDRVDAVTRIEP